MVLYRTAKKRFDEEEDFKTRSREAVTALQSGDPDSLKVITFGGRMEVSSFLLAMFFLTCRSGRRYVMPAARNSRRCMIVSGYVPIS